MKKIVTFFISLLLSSMSGSVYENIDVNIEKSIEIFGADEKPRIIFVLPEYSPEFKVFRTDDRYLLKFEKILEKDLSDR